MRGTLAALERMRPRDREAFDDKAHAANPQPWLSAHRRAALTTMALAGPAAGAVASQRN